MNGNISRLCHDLACAVVLSGEKYTLAPVSMKKIWKLAIENFVPPGQVALHILSEYRKDSFDRIFLLLTRVSSSRSQHVYSPILDKLTH